jgi:arginase family enzyme
MRQIISIPYKKAPRLGLEPYPIKGRLFSPDLEGRWTDVVADDVRIPGYLVWDLKKASNESPERLSYGYVFGECKNASKKFPKRLALSGDHGFTYPLLAEDDIEQLVVLDRHEDGVLSRQGMQVTGLNNGTWAYWLTKKKPSMRYVGLLDPCYPQAILHIRDRAARAIPVAKTSYVPLNRLKESLEPHLKDKRTALSICADCCDTFKSKYNGAESMFTPDELAGVIKMINDKTDLTHIDLMEMSLDDEGSVRAGKKVLEAAMNL